MSHSLNSLKGVIWGIIYGTTIGVIKGDTRSLVDNGSYVGGHTAAGAHVAFPRDLGLGVPGQVQKSANEQYDDWP